MIPEMEELLRRAGFVTRGKNRAKCPYCNGRDQITVAYTENVYHCHRCHKKGSRLGLARNLGLLSTEKLAPIDRREVRLDQESVNIRRSRRAVFDVWRAREIEIASDMLRRLGLASARAELVLTVYPEEELAWGCIASFRHAEAKLRARLDLLMCAAASQWLEYDAMLADVVAEWEKTL